MVAKPPTFAPPGGGPKLRQRWSGAPDRRRSAAARGYGHAWRALRDKVLAEQPGCAWPGCRERAAHVDHILAKRWGGTDARSNLQGLCGLHHRHKTYEEQDAQARAQPKDLTPVLGPLVIVTGSPGSGKSTFAEKLVGRANCLDLDVIKASLSGKPVHVMGSEWVAPALVLRNHALRQMARVRFASPAALIIGAPLAAERTRWRGMLGARAVVVVETPADEALKRIRSDQNRNHCVEQHVALVQSWWARYTRAAGEIQATPHNAEAALRDAAQALAGPDGFEKSRGERGMDHREPNRPSPLPYFGL